MSGKEKRMRVGRGELILMLAVVFAVSGAAVISDCLEKREAEEQYEELREEIMEETEEAVSVIAVETKQDVVSEERESEEIPYQAPQGLLDLMGNNSSVIGWIKIKDTNIDYPVVQNKEDNEWFLHRDINGEESKPGSIYLDSNHEVNEKGIHAIYGHRMKNGTMFKDIARFTDSDYLKNHKEIVIWTEEREIRLEPVFCYTGEADGSYRSLFYSGKELESFLFDKTGCHISSDNVFVFITCSYEQQDGRCYLICSEAD